MRSSDKHILNTEADMNRRLRKRRMVVIVLLLGVVALPLLFRAFIAVYRGVYGDIPTWAKPRYKLRGEMIRGFTLRTANPEAYWGRNSISVKVAHPRFDTVVYNPFPDQIKAGYVIMGIGEGSILCYYLDVMDNLIINDKTFSWSYMAFPGRDRSQVNPIALKLSKREFDDLRELSRLIHDPEVLAAMENTARRFTKRWLERFQWDIESIAKARQGLENSPAK